MCDHTSIVQSRALRQQSISYNSRLIKSEVIRPLLNIISEDTRALRAKVTALRNVTVKGLKVYGTNLQQFTKALNQLIRIHRRQSIEIVEVRTLYRKEALQRKLLYNEVGFTVSNTISKTKFNLLKH